MTSVPAGSPRVDVGKLADAHLFGEQRVEQQNQPQVTVEQAPPSTRAYRIASLAHDAEGKSSSVVLEVTPGDMAFFKPGDNVEAGVLLKDVGANAILLETNGRPERIEYIGVRQPVLIRVTNASKGSDGNQIVDWSWALHWNRLQVKDVLEKLGLALVNGQFVVTGESPLLANWNIAASDHLLSVNGKPLDVVGNVKQVLEPLSLPGRVSLVFENQRRRNLVRWERKM